MDYKNDKNYKEATARSADLDESIRRLISFHNMLLVGQEVNENLMSLLRDIINDLIYKSTELEVCTTLIVLDFYNYHQAVNDLKKIPIVKGIVEKKGL